VIGTSTGFRYFAACQSLVVSSQRRFDRNSLPENFRKSPQELFHSKAAASIVALGITLHLSDSTFIPSFTPSPQPIITGS
jgi:hypothetical protein